MGAQVRRDSEGRQQAAYCIVDGEIVVLDHRGSPDFAGLQAALSGGKTDDLIFFAFDLLFGKGQDLRQQSLVDRKQALKAVIEKAYGKNQAEIRYVEHFENGGEAVLKSACTLEIAGLVEMRKKSKGHNLNWPFSWIRCWRGEVSSIGPLTELGSASALHLQGTGGFEGEGRRAFILRCTAVVMPAARHVLPLRQ